MKKFLFLSLFILGIQLVSGQILSRVESWPDASWSIAGSFTPAALISNPTTVDSQFKFDTSLVSPSGGATLLTLSSPAFDLKPAFDGGEKAFKLSFDIAFQTFSLNILGVKYWDADTNSWVFFPQGTADIETNGNFATCTLVNVFLFLDYSGFTVNQLQNFRYQLIVDDPGNQITGVCMTAPTIISLPPCIDPSNLITTNINATDASIDWNVNGSEIFWEIEYGAQGFTLGTGTIQKNNIHPASIGNGGLTPNTAYDVYVRADCSDGDGVILSNSIGPLTFTTATLSLEEFAIDRLKLSSNPTHGQLELSGIVVNEVAIYNLSGQQLFSEKFNTSKVNLDLSNFNTGLYFLRVFTDSGIGVYKIIKN